MPQTKRSDLECGGQSLLSPAQSGTRNRAARDQRFASVTLALSLLLGACGGGGGGNEAPMSSLVPTWDQPATVATSERRQEPVGSHGIPAPKASDPASASGISISAQPRSVVVASGQVAIFAVAASGTGPLKYQWQVDGIDIAGAKASTYMTGTLSWSDADSVYSVIVSNSVQRVTSAGAQLTVNLN